MRLGKKANLSQEKTELVPELVKDAPKKKQKSFSLWRVTILLGGIFGTLGFIALPSFLNCADKAKQAEGKTYVGSMNRAQQANFEEKKAFANSVEATGVGIKSQTMNYNYSIQTTKAASFQYGIPRKDTLKSYVGGVFVIPATTTKKSEMTTASILCEALKPGLTTPIAPTLIKNVPTCGTDTKEKGRISQSAKNM